MRTSPQRSSGVSPKTMVPPSSSLFAIAQPVARTTALMAPTLPPLGSRSPGYSSNSNSHSTSPSTGSGSLPEIQNQDAPSLIICPSQISSANLNAQKRAYRQRRKDPSCDACRERKVKCDATETSACSECSSRNHRCQFTKETNRRMSSIKQVQDLQSQIAELTQVNSQLRTNVSDKDPLEIERTDMKRRYSEAQVSTPSVSQRMSVPVLKNFDHVRNNIRKHAQGIFSTPHQNHSVPAESTQGLPEVPLRADFVHLSRSYLQSIHEWYPALHWPTFQHEVDEVYASKSFEGSSREWIGLFFAVLACGTLQPGSGGSSSPSAVSRGSAFFETGTMALQPWPQDLSITHAQAALLLSIFAAENNMQSMGSMWLASAARVAQELQICPEVDCWPPVDSEVRRRVWWAIYVRDRITSLETNRPMLIQEGDCEISLPSTIDDRYIQPNGAFRSRANAVPFTGSVATIHIARLYAPLYQALKSSVILPHALRSFDEQFQSKLLLLPDTYQTDSGALFDAAALPTVFTLLSARFHLYRRNFTPASSPTERVDALNRCTSVAQDTAKYVSRAVHNPQNGDPKKSWNARVAPIANNMVCLHLWRCILVLCLRGEYDAALMCLHLSSAIADVRKVNLACGRNMAFFLDRLLDQIRSDASLQQLENDEEMMAYVSADAQGSLEHSWVWAGTDLNCAASTQTPPHSATQSFGLDEQMKDALPSRAASSAPTNSTTDRDVWGRIDHVIRQLMEEHRQRSTQSPIYYPPPHNPVKRVQLAPDTRSSPKPALSSASRISIANII
ncbi:hypothetical protein EJ02DRAFT_440361 [Clathrospora elynae]|uniref:Zn(2)-C6 fungal-type domain-containing protein n=1 Tax=Clathrospora elynae TaxID=706981 RepID=A0A6A5TF69_9PLEO|nr:hypothetical protein EJ02DRAFT_440361 [Clathrospora elynae]